MLSKKQPTQEGLVTKAQYFSFANAIQFAKGLFCLFFHELAQFNPSYSTQNF